ncbi:MAG: hypothetical protein JXR19_08490 [Bacteroidia bacterium]
MGKKNRKKKEPIKQAPKTQPKAQSSSLFERLDNYLGKRHKLVAYLITLVALILSLLMFDAKISTGLDDSTYIVEGFKYSQDFFGHFFTSQAPFYAMVLAIPIAMFGIKVVLLKIISVVFFTASVYVLYRAFRFKVAWSVLFIALFIYATNSNALQYASLTYTEALYVLIQALFVWASLNLIEKLSNEMSMLDTLKTHWLKLALMSVAFYFMFFTRTVGISGIAVFGLYFLLRKEWKLMTLVPAFMAVTYGFFGLVKKLIWSDVDQFSTQSKILFQKDAYDATQGNEDFSGFITRMLENANQYFSSRFYEILGFREYPSEWIFGLMVITVAPIVVVAFRAWKRKEKTALFNTIFIAGICAFTFLALQTSWGQARYIMIMIPFIFIAVFGLIHELFSKKNMRFYQFFALIFFAIFVFKNLGFTWSLAQKNIPIAKQNLFEGDNYAGYTPDWVNFLKMSEWCSENLNDSDLVASRKAPMSFLYGNGKEFYPIWRTKPNPDPDSTLRVFKEKGVTHVIVGSLRVNVKTSQGGIINTVHRVLQPIDQKYPGKLQVVHTIGTAEQAQLIKIDY